MLWHLGPCWHGRDCPSQDQPIPKIVGSPQGCFANKTQSLRSLYPNRFPYWALTLRATRHPPSSPQGQVPGNLDSLFVPGPLKSFELVEPKAVSSASPTPSHGNQNKDARCHVPCIWVKLETRWWTQTYATEVIHKSCAGWLFVWTLCSVQESAYNLQVHVHDERLSLRRKVLRRTLALFTYTCPVCLLPPPPNTRTVLSLHEWRQAGVSFYLFIINLFIFMKYSWFAMLC